MTAITIVYNWTISLFTCSFDIRFTLFGMNHAQYEDFLAEIYFNRPEVGAQRLRSSET